MGVSARALRAGRAVIELSLLTGPVEKGLRSLQQKVGRIGQSIKRLGSFNFGTSGLAGLQNLFVGSAAATAVAWPVKMAANLEVAAAQLGVFVGGADRARTMLEELQRFSAVSMVDFESLAKTAALLVRYGQSADDATKNTEALAVLASGDSEEFEKLALAFAQVGSAGRLQGEEMRQFKNTAFNPLREIAERTGETMDQVKKRMEDGKISFAEVAAALRSTVGPAGRFNGMLQAISNTLSGQMRKAWAQFKLAVLPIGNEVLAPLTKFFRAINGALPAFASFVKSHSGAAKIVLGTLAAIAAGAVVFTTLGLSVTLASVAAGGVATIFGIVATSLSAIVSPAGLVIAALGGLSAWFVTSTEFGRGMVNNLVTYFGRLATVAQQTFGGIADALSAGDIQTAADVLWAGLKVTWLTGTKELRDNWIRFKDMFQRSAIEVFFGVQATWTKMVANVKSVWQEFGRWFRDAWDVIVTALAKVGETEQVKQQLDRILVESVGGRETDVKADLAKIETEKNAALAKISSGRTTAEGSQDQAVNDELRSAKDALASAQQKLAAAIDKASTEAEGVPGAANWFGPANFQAQLDGGLAKAKQSTKPIATFDTRLASQMFGKMSDAELDELKKIERNTRNSRRAGIPVV